MNRLQKNLEFLSVDPKTGKSISGLTETDNAGWVDLLPPYYFLKDGKLLWVSERTGFYHVTISNLDGTENRSLTKGNWEVMELIHFDEEIGKIWFYANKTSAIDKQLFSVNLDGSDFKLLTPEAGTHKVSFSIDGQYFVDTYSNASNPRTVELRRSNGDLVSVLGETDLAQLEKYKWSTKQFITFPAADSSVMLDGALIFPVDYEEGKQYPVIVHGYGMPGSQNVNNSWSSTFHQFLAQEGYFVFKMDSRGMSGRGESFKNLSYGNMARFLGPDQAAGVKHLASIGLIDENRVGAWGWSGGGYFTGLMLTMNADIFNVGVAVAPVMDFRYYDTIYTERSMGLPKVNVSGYDSTSVLSWMENFKGHLLVIHATLDDNVHSQNTTVLFERAVKLGKHIDIQLYPGRNHGIRGNGSTKHLYESMFNYFRQNL